MARPVNIKREEIVNMARPMFFEKGIAATEMKDIAAACGIGRSSLYRYFDAKESIALVIAGEILDGMMLALQAATHIPGTGYQRAAAGLAYVVSAMKEHPETIRFLDDFDSYFYDGYPDSESARIYAEKMTQNNNALTNALQDGVHDQSIHLSHKPEFAGRFMVNTLLAVGQRVLPRAGLLRQEQGFAEEYLDAALALLLDSIRAQK